MKTAYIIPLEGVSQRAPLSSVGGKALNLGILSRAGFTVPAGFVVTGEAFRESLSRNKAWKKIEALLKDAGGEECDREGAQEALEEIFNALAVPAVVEASIREAFEEIMGGDAAALAVRSSASIEDSAERSFAGQFDSFLGIDSPEALVDAVVKCWRSLFGWRAIEYRRGAGIAHSRASMAVLVQSMVDADVSGVMFTCNPIDGDRGKIVINAARGLGDNLAAGKESPEEFVIDRSDWGIIERRIAGEAPSGLSEGFAKALARYGARVEDYLGPPQDIEWCLSDSKFVILQSRPVTAEPPASTARVWTRANVGEALPGVPTPFTLSVMKPMLEDGMTRMLAQIGVETPYIIELVSTIQGRVYANISAFIDLVKDIPLVNLNNIPELKGTSLEREAASMPKPTLGAWIKALPILWRAMKLALTKRKRARLALRQWLDFHERFMRDDLKSRSDASLFLLFEEVINDAVPKIFIPMLEATWNSVMLFGMTERFVNRRVAEAEPGLAGKLFSAMGGVKSAQPMVEIWKLGRLALACELTDLIKTRGQYNDFTGVLRRAEGGNIFIRRVSKFMDEYGHRCVGEIETLNPRWAEDPDSVFSIIEATIEAPEESDPVARAEKLKALCVEAERKARRSMPAWVRPVFAALLKRAREAAREREWLRFHATKAYQEIRMMALEAGRRFVERGLLDRRDDVFFLTLEEVKKILGIMPMERDPAELVKSRFEERKRLMSLPDPPEVIEGDMESADMGDMTHPFEEESDCIEGLAASFGTHTGPAKLLETFRDCSKLNPGDVLVARHTDVNWSLLFSLVGAVVTEVGGPLSHAAIVAREMGVPTVVAVKDAFSIIKDGQTITVDGDNGRVWIRPQADRGQ